MSQENVRLVKEASEVMARDGLDAALAYFHPDVVCPNLDLVRSIYTDWEGGNFSSGD